MMDDREPTDAEIKAALDLLRRNSWIAHPEPANAVPFKGLRVSVGELEIDLDEQCMGRVRFDGKSLSVTGIRIEGMPGKGFKVSFDTHTLG